MTHTLVNATRAGHVLRSIVVCYAAQEHLIGAQPHLFLDFVPDFKDAIDYLSHMSPIWYS